MKGAEEIGLEVIRQRPRNFFLEGNSISADVHRNEPRPAFFVDSVRDGQNEVSRQDAR